MKIYPETTAVVKQTIEHVQVDKKETFFSSCTPRPGHSLFQYNHETGELSKAKFELMPADFKNPKKIRKKIIMEKGVSYISALNEKNACKKLGIPYTK